MRTLIRTSYAFVAAAAVITAVACNSSQQVPAIGNVTGQASVHHDKTKGNRPAELWNEILPYPCYSGQKCPTDFEIIFKGNVTADIPSNIPLSTHENAFCPASGSGCDPSVTYNASNNTTTVEYSGSTLYHNRVGGAAGVHFGMMAARNYTTNIKGLAQSTEWTYPSSQAAPEPVVSINSTQPTTSKSWKYAVVYVAGTTSKSGGAEYATWNEIAYVPKTTPGSSGQQPKFSFTNYGSQPIYVTSSGGVFDLPVPTDPECLKTPACKENLTLLSELEQVSYPPPFYSGSPFVALQHPPKRMLPPAK
ncbi:MAG: hypothetical protein ABSD52_05260 [Candidatus Cybelea sp.]